MACGKTLLYGSKTEVQFCTSTVRTVLDNCHHCLGQVQCHTLIYSKMWCEGCCPRTTDLHNPTSISMLMPGTEENTKVWPIINLWKKMHSNFWHFCTLMTQMSFWLCLRLQAVGLVAVRVVLRQLVCSSSSTEDARLSVLHFEDLSSPLSLPPFSACLHLELSPLSMTRCIIITVCNYSHTPG